MQTELLISRWRYCTKEIIEIDKGVKKNSALDWRRKLRYGQGNSEGSQKKERCQILRRKKRHVKIMEKTWMIANEELRMRQKWVKATEKIEVKKIMKMMEWRIYYKADRKNG